MIDFLLYDTVKETEEKGSNAFLIIAHGAYGTEEDFCSKVLLYDFCRPFAC